MDEGHTADGAETMTTSTTKLNELPLTDDNGLCDEAEFTYRNRAYTLCRDGRSNRGNTVYVEWNGGHSEQWMDLSATVLDAIKEATR